MHLKLNVLSNVLEQETLATLYSSYRFTERLSLLALFSLS